MKYQKVVWFALAICSLWSLAGCHTSPNTTQTAADVQRSDIQKTADSTGTVTLKDTDIPEFASRVSWPDFDPESAQKPVYNINSGVNDGVWVEAKGYFRIPLDKVYEDLTDVTIMGPTYLTDDIKQKNLVKNPVLTTYEMDIKMRYIMSVEFSIGVRIEAFYDADGNLSGYLYNSNKSEGTRFIKKIDEQLVVRHIRDNWFSAEFKSLNVASMDKEEETRKHIESLFGRWEAISVAE